MVIASIVSLLIVEDSEEAEKQSFSSSERRRHQRFHTSGLATIPNSHSEQGPEFALGLISFIVNDLPLF